MPQYLDERGELIGERTTLPPAVEHAFRAWVQASGITDVDHPDSHYDYRGYFLDRQGRPEPESADRHFPDTFKQHGHPTFSVESQYSTGPQDGGTWRGEEFVPAAHSAEVYLDDEGNPIAAPSEPPMSGPTHPLARLGNFVTENLPAIAAGGASLATGGLAAIPAAMGAAAAGSGGRAILRLLQGKDPGTIREASTDALWEGGTQAIGGGLGKVLKLAGKGFYNNALGASAALKREFGDVGAVGLRERALVRGGGGLAKTQARETASVAEVERLLADADTAGVPAASPRHIVRALKAVRDKVTIPRKENALPDETAELVQRARGIRREGPKSLVRENVLKRRAQKDADTAWRAQERGAEIKDVTAHANKAVAQGRRAGIEERVPAVIPGNMRTRELEGLRQALEAANDKPQRLSPLLSAMSGATVLGATGDPLSGLATAGVTQAVASPLGQSAIGIGANEASKIPWDQVLRATRALLLERLQQQD